MKMTDLVLPEALIPELAATSRNGVIRELVERLIACAGLDESSCDRIARAVIQREQQGTTAFGKGVALPHARHPGVRRPLAAIGRSPEGIDFSALDHEPVQVVILLLSPPDRPDEHLAAMQRLYKFVQAGNTRRFLCSSQTREAMWDLVVEADEVPKESGSR